MEKRMSDIFFVNMSLKNERRINKMSDELGCVSFDDWLDRIFILLNMVNAEDSKDFNCLKGGEEKNGNIKKDG